LRARGIAVAFPQPLFIARRVADERDRGRKYPKREIGFAKWEKTRSISPGHFVTVVRATTKAARNSGALLIEREAIVRTSIRSTRRPQGRRERSASERVSVVKKTTGNKDNAARTGSMLDD
jgi:hypothetical protein